MAHSIITQTLLQGIIVLTKRHRRVVRKSEAVESSSSFRLQESPLTVPCHLSPRREILCPYPLYPPPMFSLHRPPGSGCPLPLGGPCPVWALEPRQTGHLIYTLSGMVGPRVHPGLGHHTRAKICHTCSGLQAFCCHLCPWCPRLTSHYLFGAFSSRRTEG